MSLVIFKCRICTVFWYKRRPIVCQTISPEFYLQRFSLQVLLNMATRSNPRRTLKSAQEQEDQWRRRNKRERARRVAEQKSKRLKKRQERVMSGTLLNLVVKDKLLHGGKDPVNAELIPLRREKRGTFSDTALWRRSDGITFNFFNCHTYISPSIHSYLSFSCPERLDPTILKGHHAT